MKAVVELLSELRKLNIKLWAEGDNLRYSAPKGVLTREHVAEIKAHKGDILQFLITAGWAVQANGAIRPQSADGWLSFAQERLWFLDQLEGGNPFYNVAVALRLTGKLDEAALQAAVDQLVARHAILRTTFPAQDGQAVQKVAEAERFLIARVDLTGEVDPAEKVHELALLEAQRPFDLAEGPLLRLTLLKLAADDHALFVTMHHIVSDGWSMGVLVQEVAAAYSAFVAGQENPLPPLPFQYADFATWQREQLRGAVLEKQLDYWVKQLAGLPPELKLPTDFMRPPVQSFKGDSIKFTLGRTLTQRLYALSQGMGATLFMTLSAAFAVLLGRYSGQTDIVVGTPIANRQRSELEKLIGFFVNTLVLRTDLSGDPTFAELLQAQRRTALDAYAHQDLPFEQLVDTLQPERDLSRNPLFQVMIALQNAPLEALKLPELTVRAIETERVTALFDMVVDLWESDGRVVGVWEYNCDLFTRPTIERAIGHLETLLESIVGNPQERVSQLEILTLAEKRQLLEEFDGPRRVYPVEQTLDQLFEAQVAAGPERVAAVHNGRAVTYAELNEQAETIAQELWAQGVRPDDFVAILAERGIDFVAAIVGIHKAGGAYVPIDPSYPQERVAYMLGDSGVRFVVTRGGYGEKMGEYRPEHVIDLSTEARRHGEKTELKLRTFGERSGRGRAYMLYTSGSTGLPKGAIVRHEGAVNHIFAEFELLDFHRDSAFLQSAPSSSDISVWQFLGPLLCGGRTVIADMETVADPEKLFALIQDERVTIIELVPVVMKALLDYAASLPESERALPHLQWAMATGEAVSVALINQWLATYPQIPIVNAYGPTEAADDVTQFVMREPLPLDSRSVPVGGAIPNMTMYVLDEQLQLVPVGVPGEICVAGIGVGEGYWYNPEKTAASFVPNPYSKDKHDRVLYRTGDRGRWLADGVLEHIERIDQQVKVRGFRIELGEIEGLLDQHPAVEKNATAVREDHSGDLHLVAYVVPSANGQVATQLDTLQTEQVALWQDLHESSYREVLLLDDDPTVNVIGWDSNYTNSPLPAVQMHEYINDTVARVLALRPQRVLEIGCGTGMLAFKVIPHSQHYWGIDLSAVAIAQLNELKARPEIQARVDGLEHAHFYQREAADFTDLAEQQFDTVMMPSVVQYFPSIEYLRTLLVGLAEILPQGGAIYVGDVRNLHLLEAFHASVQFYKAEDEATAAEIKQAVWQQLQQEQEMVVDPAFFVALRETVPAISQVEILPKRGTQHNEMTRFRYDVVIHVGGDEPIKPEIEWDEWSATWNVESMRNHLALKRPRMWGLRGVANARVAAELALLEWLARGSESESKHEFETVATREAIEPEDLRAVAETLGYQVDISLANAGKEGAFDVLFRLDEGRFDLGEEKPIRPWQQYANNPLQEKLARRLIPEWRDFLRSKLPSHMVPNYFVLLDELPLTPNGKIDRENLPALHLSQRASESGYMAPRDETEAQVAAIWAEVLGLEKVGVTTNFFDVGGHSLKATQVVSRIHKRLGVELPLRVLFSHPTVAELAAEVSSATASDYPTIEHVPDAPHYPLSNAQHRLWVLAQMSGASAAYNMPGALLLEGRLDRAALEKAWAAVVQRHEALRTTFVVINGKPRQVVHSWPTIAIKFVDLQDEAEPENRARQLAQEDATKEFDFGRCLVRLSLLQLAAERHVLLITMHHIVSDAWSEGVLVRDFVAAYEAALGQAAVALPPLRMQYRDYAVWQKAFLQSEAGQAQRRYWVEKLGGELPLLDFPADLARPPVKTYSGRAEQLVLDKGVTAALKALCRVQRVSLFAGLTALVKTLLYRYTGQDDIVVGSPVAGREQADLEEQIGFYINTVVLRSTVVGARPFVAFLQEMQETITDALVHQMYPFDQLVNDLNLVRDVSRNPIFDVAVVLQNVAPAELALPDVALRPFVERYEGSKFDLSFTFEERDGRLVLDIVYNSDLYKANRIQRLGRHFATLVESVLADAEQALDVLGLVPTEERRLIESFNAQGADFASDETIVGRFEAQVVKTPDNVAVSCEGEQLTYVRLNQRANQVARYLRRQGVETGDLVGLYVARSVEMVVGVLGILKAGAAYVPFDSAVPEERLVFMREDANVCVVVSSGFGIGTAESAEGAESGEEERRNTQYATRFVDLVEERVEIGGESGENLGVELRPEGAAYVIYTSGSTGRPKGCVVSHENVIRLFAATEHWFGFDERDVWTLFHSIAFDFSVWELWGALFYGGRVVVVPQMVSRDPQAFYRLVQDEGVTVLNQTPSAFRQVVQVAVGKADAATVLRYVIFGGEALELQSLRPWFELFGGERPQLVNMYGITETTVHVTYRPLSEADLALSGSVIGRPIPDLQLYILDGQRQPVPIGVAGEIYVGGGGVSLGYLRRPELTAARFIDDPVRGRLYRTGDLARYWPDGDIEYLGRIDTQVKIRGFRIELGEIESLVVAQAGIQSAAVVTQGEGVHKQIVAYVVPLRSELTKMDTDTFTNQLRSILKEKLPAYMVPAAFVVLEALPLTANGKLNRRALPAPEAAVAATKYAPPQSDLEQQLAAVWQAVLQRPQVGVHDNFFDLGGNSLNLIQVHQRLGEVLETAVDVVELFQYPTIEALAGHLQKKETGAEIGEKGFAAAAERAARQKAARERRKRRR